MGAHLPGYENKVKTGIETRIQNLEAEDEIFEVQVPMETVVEFKNTVKKTIRRVRVPGYVLVRMGTDGPLVGRCPPHPGRHWLRGSGCIQPGPAAHGRSFRHAPAGLRRAAAEPGPSRFQARYRV